MRTSGPARTSAGITSAGHCLVALLVAATALCGAPGAAAASTAAPGDAVGRAPYIVGAVGTTHDLGFRDAVQFVYIGAPAGGGGTGYVVRGRASGSMYLYSCSAADPARITFAREIVDGGRGVFREALAMAASNECLVVARGEDGATIARVSGALDYQETAVVPTEHVGGRFVRAAADGAHVAIADAAGYVVLLYIDSATCQATSRLDIRVSTRSSCTPNDVAFVGHLLYTACAEGHVLVVDQTGTFVTQIEDPSGAAVTRLSNLGWTTTDAPVYLSAGSTNKFQLVDVADPAAPSIDGIEYMPDFGFSMAVANPHAHGIVYAASASGIYRVHAADKTALVITEVIGGAFAPCTDLTIAGDAMFVLHGAAVTSIIDLEVVAPTLRPTPAPTTPRPAPPARATIDKTSPRYLASPEFTDTPLFEAGGGHYESPAFKASPTYKQQPEYQGGPVFSDTPAFYAGRGGAPAYKASPTYKESPAYTDTPEFAKAGTPVVVGSPGYKATPAYFESPEFTDTPTFNGEGRSRVLYHESPRYRDSPEYTDTPLFEAAGGRYDGPRFKESPTAKDTPFYKAHHADDDGSGSGEEGTGGAGGDGSDRVDTPERAAEDTKYVAGHRVRNAVMFLGGASALGATLVAGGAGGMRLAAAALPCDIRDYDAALRYHFVMNPLHLVVADSHALGAVIGAFVVFAVLCALAVALWVMNKLLLEDFFPEMVRELRLHGLPCLPSVLIVAAHLVYQAAVMGSIDLIVEPQTEWMRAVGSAVGLPLLAVPFLVVYGVRKGVPSLAAVRKDATTKGVVRQFMLGPGEWVNLHPGEHWVERYSAALRPYAPHALWVAGLDLAASYAIAVAHAMHPTTWSGCGYVKAITLGVFAAMIVVNVAVWPHLHTRNAGFDILALGLLVAAMALMGWGYYSEQRDHFGFDVGSLVLLLAAVVVVGKTILDVLGTLYGMWIQRRTKVQHRQDLQARGEHEVMMKELGADRRPGTPLFDPKKRPQRSMLNNSSSCYNIGNDSALSNTMMSSRSVSSDLSVRKSVSFGPAYVSEFGDNPKADPLHKRVSVTERADGSGSVLSPGSQSKRSPYNLPDVPMDETVDFDGSLSRMKQRRANAGDAEPFSPLQLPLRQQASLLGAQRTASGMAPPRSRLRQHDSAFGKKPSVMGGVRSTPPQRPLAAGGYRDSRRMSDPSPGANPLQPGSAELKSPTALAMSEVSFTRVESTYTPPLPDRDADGQRRGSLFSSADEGTGGEGANGFPANGGARRQSHNSNNGRGGCDSPNMSPLSSPLRRRRLSSQPNPHVGDVRADPIGNSGTEPRGSIASTATTVPLAEVDDTDPLMIARPRKSLSGPIKPIVQQV